MKSLVQAVVVAAALVAPVVSFAQSGSTITRAQVRAELVQLQQAGYNSARGEDPHYPEAIQAATARVAEQQRALAQAQGVDASGYGAQAQGASASGSRAIGVRPASDEEMKSLYRGS
ncbi:DUF4148 domain-containing protein [Burkholderia pseudomultivorans]|uniref:DUF4148 domain-containing protein n=1 Tax=Burkholderia pseudomultivorans TaxID=1207504 RepID=UPI0001FD8119|nr:DUF4148 domain-containing protein [Burkholderia pseudomultivorans]EGD02085.1 hypothetical protein B1M_23291 [Burkholderia sp. TJI49]AOI91571.1 hypothetical protein WS57_22730 [Burkholderia pseudomultivorans]KVC26916.1 hypothetical protein WS55_14185 [Burkholderia pseudomultivorans]KVC31978.1 hypothetical protein WS56_15340 [Burkholderia pseudomultivorans]KVC58203.1 hypothetical protein WS58_02540 [Burkholderia pseudomultivorans]